MDYIKIEFSDVNQAANDRMIAELSQLDYEGFEEKNDNTLIAYIPKKLFNSAMLKKLAENNQIDYTISELPSTNWNALWESNFQPVIVDDFCTVRAGFHAKATGTIHEIIITPKMSFGTGHHATTFMMMQQMRSVDMAGKRVLDFGTGTGVLAILAKKLGADQVTAIDNDEWSIENARENFAENNAEIELINDDKLPVNTQYDIILANITKNVIVDNFRGLKNGLTNGAILILSGLLKEDEITIAEKAASLGFELEKKLERDNWISLKYKILFG